MNETDSLPTGLTGGVKTTLPAAVDIRQQYVVFSLDKQKYGVDIMAVREIRMMQQITLLPGAPVYVCGVINLRGSIVPVCDLRSRFANGRTEPVPGNAIVIVTIDRRPYGLIVDEVNDIVSIPAGDIAPVPEVQSGRANPLFKGLITMAQGMLIVLDLSHLLSAGSGDEVPPNGGAPPTSRAN